MQLGVLPWPGEGTRAPSNNACGLKFADVRRSVAPRSWRPGARVQPPPIQLRIAKEKENNEKRAGLPFQMAGDRLHMEVGGSIEALGRFSGKSQPRLHARCLGAHPWADAFQGDQSDIVTAPTWSIGSNAIPDEECTLPCIENSATLQVRSAVGAHFVQLWQGQFPRVVSCALVCVAISPAKPDPTGRIRSAGQ